MSKDNKPTEVVKPLVADTRPTEVPLALTLEKPKEEQERPRENARRRQGLEIPKLPPDTTAMLKEAFGASNEREPSYPPNKAGAKDRIEQWKDQKRQKCRHSRCYYPLNFVRVQGQMVEVTTEEGPSFLALCSWDPSHMNPDGGSFQYITKETVDDAIKEGRGPRR